MNTENIAHDLERMAELLQAGWCQGLYARDADGVEVGETEDDAVSFCIVGAIRKTLLGRSYGWMKHSDQSYDVRKVLANAIGDRSAQNISCTESSLSSWNDHTDRTQKEVVCLCLDIAASLRKSAED